MLDALLTSNKKSFANLRADEGTLGWGIYSKFQMVVAIPSLGVVHQGGEVIVVLGNEPPRHIIYKRTQEEREKWTEIELNSIERGMVEDE